MKLRFKKIDLLITGLVVLLFIFFSTQSFSFFEGLERIVYSIEMRLDLPRITGRSRIAIVNIDDKSLKQLGPWPWPRHLIAEMIGILKSNGARLIALDMLLTQKEKNQGLEEIMALHDAVAERQQRSGDEAGYGWILARLKQIKEDMDNDKKLASAVRESGNIVLPVVGTFGKLDTELVAPVEPFLQKNFLNNRQMDTDLRRRVSVIQIETPYRELAEISYALGHTNLSADEAATGQAHLPFILYRGNSLPSLPLRLALDFLNIRPDQATVLSDGIQLRQQVIPTSRGEVFVKYKGGRRSFPYYSFVDILKVRKVPAVFEDKIVLIGYTPLEGGISFHTPVDPRMPRVELIANIIDSFLDGRYLERPGTVIYVEIFLTLILGLLSAFILPRLNYFPRTMVTGAALFLLFLASLILFMGLNIWMKTIYVGLSLVTLYVVFSVKELVVTERTIEISSKESMETNRMLGLSLQSQGLLDLAFEKFRKIPLDDDLKGILYNLGLDFERKRMMTKAISVYEYILQKGAAPYRDLDARLPKLKKFASELPLGKHGRKKGGKIIVSDELETKPTVGRYEILEELGQGAMGVVYKAKDPKINRLVAIKTIRFADDFEESQIKEVKERFFKEAEVAGQLSHPAIIAVYDVGEDYDLTYMAMELLDGEDLDNYSTRDSLLPVRKVIGILAHAAEALDYAHSHGVIHRDVKPGNIMLLKDGNVKVTDFGIAKAMSSSMTKSGIILGTPNYMSPEQINGKPLDGRSDVFSLGAVFFQLLTGQLPFGGKTITELFYQITQVKHPSARSFNPKVIKPCETLLDKALAKDPDLRFQTAGDFAKYLKVLGSKIDQLAAKRG